MARKINLQMNTEVVISIENGNENFMYCVDGEFILRALKTYIEESCDTELISETRRTIKKRKK